MDEGSVAVDTGSMPTMDSSLRESQDTGEETKVDARDQSESSDQGDQGDQGDEQRTAKGTKLDPNPLSAAHQELANARATIKQYEKVLNTPEYLKRYAAGMGMTLAEAKAEIKEEVKEQKKLFTPDRFKTSQDIADAMNEIHSMTAKELEELRSENAKLKEGFGQSNAIRQIERVTTNMQSDISSVQEKYSVLNPKSADYDPELENEIGSLYHELDFDEESGGYRGRVSIAKIADRVMRAAGRAGKQASRNAQTDVRVKQAGKVVTSSKAAPSGGSESKDPATVIAQRIKEAMGN